MPVSRSGLATLLKQMRPAAQGGDGNHQRRHLKSITNPDVATQLIRQKRAKKGQPRPTGVVAWGPSVSSSHAFRRFSQDMAGHVAPQGKQSPHCQANPVKSAPTRGSKPSWARKPVSRTPVDKRQIFCTWSPRFMQEKALVVCRCHRGGQSWECPHGLEFAGVRDAHRQAAAQSIAGTEVAIRRQAPRPAAQYCVNVCE